MSKSKVLIKLYGESFKIHSLDIKRHPIYIHKFKEVAQHLGDPLELAILNVNFFKELNIEQITAIQDLIAHTFGGLCNNKKAKIEIRNGRKQLQKFNLNELFYPKSLLPLFNVSIGNIVLRLK